MLARASLSPAKGTSKSCRFDFGYWQLPTLYKPIRPDKTLLITMVGLDSITRLGRGCEGRLLEEISSWISVTVSTPLEHSSSTSLSLNGWKLTDEEHSTWKSVFLGNSHVGGSTVTSTSPHSSKVHLVKYRHNEDVTSPPTRMVKTLDRKESYKRTNSSPKDAKDARLKVAANARKRKKDAHLQQRRSALATIPLPTSSTSVIEPFGNLLNSESLEKKPRRVHFNLEKNATIDIPRVDPNDKASLFYRRKDYKTMNSDEQNLFHTYHFYQEMYGLETNLKNRDALLRRMSSIANIIFRVPSSNAGKPKRKTPTKKKKKIQPQQQQLPVAI